MANTLVRLGVGFDLDGPSRSRCSMAGGPVAGSIWTGTRPSSRGAEVPETEHRADGVSSFGKLADASGKCVAFLYVLGTASIRQTDYVETVTIS